MILAKPRFELRPVPPIRPRASARKHQQMLHKRIGGLGERHQKITLGLMALDRVAYVLHFGLANRRSMGFDLHDDVFGACRNAPLKSEARRAGFS